VAAAAPNAKLYGPDGVAEEAFTNPKKGGIPANVGARTKVTVATLGLQEFKRRKNAQAERFFADFQKTYNDPTPDPYAIYGYETMKLALDTLKAVGDKANDRKAVADQLINKTKNRQSVLGTYSIDKNGDTSLTDYGLYVIKDGLPTFDKVIKASK
jgi:branched-chain amino acid transport system substrate-binding protein